MSNNSPCNTSNQAIETDNFPQAHSHNWCNLSLNCNQTHIFVKYKILIEDDFDYEKNIPYFI